MLGRILNLLSRDTFSSTNGSHAILVISAGTSGLLLLSFVWFLHHYRALQGRNTKTRLGPTSVEDLKESWNRREHKRSVVHEEFGPVLSTYVSVTFRRHRIRSTHEVEDHVDRLVHTSNLRLAGLCGTRQGSLFRTSRRLYSRLALE